ncbi:MAG: alpha/beta hydrolase [Comamonadaceae bacterium]|nr:alpha/beta hydrolase [Comamonadaceae bacterium]
MNLLLAAAGIAAFVYGSLLAALYLLQERIIFLPERLPAQHRFDFGADVHERWIEVPGARLNALHLKSPSARGIVFYLHGNAGNLQSWFGDAAFYREQGFDLFMLDYRGYGKSSGRIRSEAELHADVRAAWNAIAASYAGRLRVVVGRSLGSALAARLAAEVQPDLTLLVSPYRSLTALAAEHYPWVPSRLLRYPMRTDASLPDLHGAVLIVHGARDKVIAAAHGRSLQALVPQARLVIVPAAGHGDVQDFPQFHDAVAAALRAL